MVKNDCVVSTWCARASITIFKYAKQLASICLWNSIFYREQSTSFLNGLWQRVREGDKEQDIFQASWNKIDCQHWLYAFFISLSNAPNAYATKSDAMHYSAFEKQKKSEIGLNTILVAIENDERKREFECVSLEIKANLFLNNMLCSAFKNVVDWIVERNHAALTCKHNRTWYLRFCLAKKKNRFMLNMQSFMYVWKRRVWTYDWKMWRVFNAWEAKRQRELLLFSCTSMLSFAQQTLDFVSALFIIRLRWRVALSCCEAYSCMLNTELRMLMQ